MACARKLSPSLQGFVCLEEYKLSELTQVYDAFVLHKPPVSVQTPFIAPSQSQLQPPGPLQPPPPKQQQIVMTSVS